MNELSPEWQSWVDHNIAQGCTVESMIEAMVKSNFDAASAFLTIEAATKKPWFSHTGRIIQTNDKQVRILFRMSNPLVVLLENLLTDQECDQLIAESVSKLKRSVVVDPDTGQSAKIDGRTSEGTFFYVNESQFIQTLDRRISEVMQLPSENGEGLQVMRYGTGGEYRAHFDYFDTEKKGPALHLAKGGQRVSTLVIYLNDVDRGGETTFPDLGVSFPPKKGSAVYFEYCDRLGKLDDRSLHAGEPVLSGEKWIATKWMRQDRYSHE
jgi:prolyl 4-hydroxylase